MTRPFATRTRCSASLVVDSGNIGGGAAVAEMRSLPSVNAPKKMLRFAISFNGHNKRFVFSRWPRELRMQTKDFFSRPVLCHAAVLPGAKTIPGGSPAMWAFDNGRGRRPACSI